MASPSFSPLQAGYHGLATSSSTFPYYYYIYYYTTNLLNSYPNQYFAATTSCYNSNLLPCYATTVTTTTQQQQRPLFFYFDNASIFYPAGSVQQSPAMMTLLPSSAPAQAPPPPYSMLSADTYKCTDKLKAGDQAEAILAPSKVIAGGSTRGIKKVCRKAKSEMMFYGGERRTKTKQVARLQPVVNQLECSKTKTTVMIKNIPNKFTRATLLEVLDEHCKKENQSERLALEEKGVISAYDFVYLPIDFSSKSNKGYAFVNFTDPAAAWKFHLSFNNYKWGVHNSKKICEVTYARIQGKEALVKHFEDSGFACDTEEFLPLCFEAGRDGSGEAAEQRVVGRLVCCYA